RVCDPGSRDSVARDGVDGAIELRKQATVEPGAPALVIVVVDAAATTVHVLELSGPALSIQVLVLRQLERGLEGDVAAGGDLRGADQPARFRRDEDCAVCRTRSVQRRGIRTLQHRDGLDV